MENKQIIAKVVIEAVNCAKAKKVAKKDFDAFVLGYILGNTDIPSQWYIDEKNK